MQDEVFALALSLSQHRWRWVYLNVVLKSQVALENVLFGCIHWIN